MNLAGRVTTRRVFLMASASKANANGSDLPYELPWYVVLTSQGAGKLIHGRVEKYRPSVLDDIVGNSDTISRLKVIAKDGNVPHLIISVTGILAHFFISV